MIACVDLRSACTDSPESGAVTEQRFDVDLVIITSNTALAGMPGNVFLAASATGLPMDSTVNVTAPVTLNKSDLEDSDSVADLPDYLMGEVDRGLRRVLYL